MVGIDEPGPAGEVVVYPNPAKDFILLDGFRNPEGLFLVLINSAGKQVSEASSVRGKSLRLDVSAYPSGVYYLLLRKNGRTMEAKKILLVD
jgi:hypothetical protein